MNYTNQETRALQPSKNHPGWSTFLIKRLEYDFKYCRSVLMGDYVIILAHDNSLNPSASGSDYSESCQADSDYDSELENPVPSVLLAINLRDYSVQEVEMEEFAYEKDYTLNMYKDNKIIKFGGLKNNHLHRDLCQITITSLNPFKAESEKIKTRGKGPATLRHTAQIYEDSLYVFTGEQKDKSCIYRCDLITLEWKKCHTTGEGPVFNNMQKSGSFLVDENMYIYGGGSKKDIFILSLKSFAWTRIPLQDNPKKQMDLIMKDTDGGFYRGNFLTLNQKSQTDELCCWNIEMNSWFFTNIQKSKLYEQKGNLVIYKNLLLITADSKDGLSMAILNLNSNISLIKISSKVKLGLKLPVSESPEKKLLKSLFMNEEESDMKFKVEDKIIPAKKQVLMEKSQYFANLFESGMIESKQEIIEIKDCEHAIFQEFLRFIYCEECKLDIHTAFKLIILADKYLQDDLKEKCMDFLMFNIGADNVYTILGFACKEGIPSLKTRCMKFLKNDLNPHNVSSFIKYLDANPKSKSQDENLGLAKKALKIVLDSYIEVLQHQTENLQLYEGFLIKSLDLKTFPAFKKLICNERYHPPARDSEGRIVGERGFTNLQRHVFDFDSKNRETLEEENSSEDHKNPFDRAEMSFSFLSILHKVEKKKYQNMDMMTQENEENETNEDRKEHSEPETLQRNTHKRREPSNNDNDIPNENPLLKQTKKDFSKK